MQGIYSAGTGIYGWVMAYRAGMDVSEAEQPHRWAGYG